MEVVNFIKQTAEELEKILVDDVIKTKKMNNYNDIEDFTKKLTTLKIYLFKLNLEEQEQEQEQETKKEKEKETEQKIDFDKYYISAKNKTPNAQEKTILYEAEIMRKKGKTHEEFNEYQKEKIDRIKKMKKENEYEYENSKNLQIGQIISKCSRGDCTEYYKVLEIDEKKNKYITKQIEKEYFGWVSSDYPYNQNTTTYYIYDINVLEDEQISFPIRSTRGKEKGNKISYNILEPKTNKWICEHDSFTD